MRVTSEMLEIVATKRVRGYYCQACYLNAPGNGGVKIGG
jgi:hypothetical protein